MNIAIIIPVWEPDSYFVEYVKELNEAGLSQIIVMDDASVTSCRPYLEQVEKEGALVYHHITILGRGACIKEGIRKAQEHFRELKGYVTVDPNGLYSVKDVLSAVQALEDGEGSLILGLREEAAARWITKGQTQKIFTGLRAYSSDLTEVLLNAPGQRSTYETEVMNQLLERGDPIGIVHVKNETPVRHNSFKIPLTKKSWIIAGITTLFNLVIFLIFVLIILHLKGRI